MSIAYCPECERVVETQTKWVDLAKNKALHSEGEVEVCSACGTRVVYLQDEADDEI